MSLELHMKYCETVYRRYRNASKESKTRILDELCQVCGIDKNFVLCCDGCVSIYDPILPRPIVMEYRTWRERMSIRAKNNSK